MNKYDNQMMPLQAGESFPFMGRLVDATRTDTGISVQVPADMLKNAGIPDGTSKVEVWREMSDGTICFRIATRCELCGRGSRLYELDLGFVKKGLCAEDYFKLTGKNPPQEPVTIENTTQIEQL
ncbi:MULTISPECIES: hypothetical protein [Bacillus]|uniref:hypothetical protein n=1 Tax=Bacillus TaxID=1386 RepID=UPI00019FEF9F|nr:MULTISPECIES: hypothetical protein [Bacillus]MBJ3789479.1 hypothetical protein [Bacillus sp. OA1]MDJ0282795.1 hypothetical protein [Bacillus bombysepticus]EEK49331.1 hypothetical protein bcere0002_35880 [Bacillus cereus ATCC 10876]EEM82458.1 hypothetical protein bthur0011_35090 [Bacillus thuringiensis serovar huazhongensis BGSC 4BD1]EJR82895.1 hypothetical protein IK7_02169 [Bacillus cereus VD156]